MSKTNTVPFVKWVGGKRQLLTELIKRMPKKYNTYIEPFIGGGALFLALQPSKAIINDLNKELMTAYKLIKSSPNRLVEFLTLMEMGHKPEMYYSVRDMDRGDKYLSMPFRPSNLLRTARFIYLNKAGFNGLYRVNSKGHFNVPSAKREKLNTHNFTNISNISKYLKDNKDIKIINKSFEKACEFAKKNDFIYFDPPYDYKKGQNGFDSYLKRGFGIDGQIKLAELCKSLDKKGVKFMLSNHNTNLINDCYKNFNIEVIKAKRLVGGKNASRADVEEVVIRNYE